MNLLETTDLTVSFGGLHANDSVNITVPDGSFVGLIGPNGAGKTTFIDAITGFVPLASGHVSLAGEGIDGLGPHERVRRGLSRTFQSLELFEDLSVGDNLLAAADRPRWWSFLADVVRPGRSTGVEDDVAWALEVVGLSDSVDRMPSDLSHGQRKLVGVARALAGRPRLVLLDEPAAGLDTAESQNLGQRLRTLLDHDITVFLIDHDMGLVLNVCDHIYVLDFGQIIAAGTPADIRADPAVISAYLGEQAGEAQAASGQRVRELGEEHT
ncbi:MAG: ABC transporter ATP-binding protein [Acidimicrobiia bacterium]|nr:ABC transporter ATP-binding protein [Acidimicrobiia bacterium]